MPRTPTATQLLADQLLPDGGVAKFIADRRAGGSSWRRIALDLRDQTQGKVDVTEATIRNWAAETAETAA